MQRFVLLLVILFFTITKANGQLNLSNKEKTKAMVISKVKALREVKDFFKYGKQHSQSPGLMIDTEPDKKFKYYVVKMGIAMLCL